MHLMLARLLLLILTVTLVTGPARPAHAAIISTEQEIEIGREAAQEIERESGVR